MMQRSLWVGFVLVLAGCDNPGPLDAGIDSGMDAGRDAGTDSGPVWVGPGCDPTNGIQCDGNWEGACDPACDATECCSPQHAMSVAMGGAGVFVCVPRGADGSCPTANISVDDERIVGPGGEPLYAVEYRFFAADDCAVAEGCVEAAGMRRLLRFGTWTPNTGTADLYLGVPTNNPPFVYSSCHDHFHFEGYAEYELRTTGGGIAATGHKQAFCLEDFYQNGTTNDTGYYYVCEHQGIQRGWQDVYDADLDCQWIDVTDVAAGDYTLRIDLNVNHTLLESNYADNRIEVPVTIPPPDVIVDVTAACTFPRYDLDRDCGWNFEATHTCTPTNSVRVSCSAACGATTGSCTGDTVLRVCDTSVTGANPNNCVGMAVIASDDDSGCTANDTCSSATFPCPASGEFNVFWAGYDEEPASCTVAVQ